MNQEPQQTPPPPPPAQGSGLEPNVAGLLAYVLGPITGILFLVIEKRSAFVRFHAAQSIVVFIALIVLWVVVSIISFVLGVIPVIGWIIGILLSLALFFGSFALWIFLMYQAFQNQQWEVPGLGDFARRLAGGGAPPA